MGRTRFSAAVAALPGGGSWAGREAGRPAPPETAPPAPGCAAGATARWRWVAWSALLFSTACAEEYGVPYDVDDGVAADGDATSEVTIDGPADATDLFTDQPGPTDDAGSEDHEIEDIVEHPPSSCPCLGTTDNFCLYPHDTPGCPMLLPGGYCDPNGNGNFEDDGDWARGWTEYHDLCPWTCDDGGCNAPSENCGNCPADCGSCPPTCGDGACDTPSENCGNCPADCGSCPPTCGDGACTGDENCLSCPADCPRHVSVACGLLGAQDIGGSPGFSSFLSGCPRIAKWLGGAGSTPAAGWAPFDAMAAYKCACGGTTVLRLYGPPASFATGDDLWRERYGFLESVLSWQRAAVDYLESDNECDAGHCWFDPADPSYSPSPAHAAAYATFLQQWVARASAHGFRPLVGNLSVGAPGGDIDRCDGDGMRTFAALLPAIRSAAAAGGGWGYHSYTTDWSTDPSSGMAPYLAFRYRKYVRCLPELESIPLIFTEAGFDLGGNPDADGYRAHGGWAAYGPWLSWYQSEIARDAYVRGALLFAFSAPGSWSSFRLDDDETALRAVLGPPACTP
ncbi:MAG: hypothetical protein GYA57_16915 [Myxococcales bacterium]|nr:hypothetical protein [Myxococcales bacterium]